MLDLLLLAGLAGLIAWRVYLTLGTRQEEDHLRVREKKVVLDAMTAMEAAEKAAETVPQKLSVEAFQRVVPAFSSSAFLTGAGKAFEQIFEAYQAGQVTEIRHLVASDVYASFEAGVKARDEEGDIPPVTLERILQKEIDAIEVYGPKGKQVCRIGVFFISLQRVHSNERDTAEYTEEIEDTWTFECSLQDVLKNKAFWRLVRTTSEGGVRISSESEAS